MQTRARNHELWSICCICVCDPGGLYCLCKIKCGASQKGQAQRDNNVSQWTSCTVSDFAACGHNPPLVVPGLCAHCPLHSSRDSSYELGIFPHHFPWHASDDQGKAISRPLAADTWQEQQTCSSGRSSIHLFSQNIIGSHLFFSCIGLLHHSSHLIHFSILWNGIPNQDCGTQTQQRARCYQHSQASGRRRFTNLSERYH